MKATTIEGATRILGAPKGWNAGRDGECVGLPILEAQLASGQPCMISAWKPTPEELDRLMKGAAVELCVCGVVHPPVSMNPLRCLGQSLKPSLRRQRPPPEKSQRKSAPCQKQTLQRRSVDVQLFVDMDGVLADFDRHYAATIGPLPDRADPNRDVDWSKINDVEFFAGIPPMPDAFELWDYVGRHKPIILTGCPKTGRERAERNKREWVRCHLGEGVEVRTVLSKEKSLHCSTGDILIDDWPKYRDLWVARGGIWVTHTSAADTIDQLWRHGIGL